MKRRGWIVWTWGKMGSLVIFMGILMMLLETYAFSSSAIQAESANRLSARLRNAVLDTYNSVGDMSLEYELPKSINGEDYSVEVLDKSGDMVGIVARTKNGNRGLVGASSFAAPLSESSFGELKGFGERVRHVCIVKYGGLVYLERSRCA